MAAEPNKVIYSMVGVGKYYEKRAVLKDIYLSYFYGAKLSVIGLNGSDKSSLLRIMTGSTGRSTAKQCSRRGIPSNFGSRNR